MNARVGASVLVPSRASPTATGRATSSVKATIATAAQPSPNSPSSVSSEPKTTKTPSLTISTMSSDALLERVADVVAQDAERDRAHEDRDQAVAGRRDHGDAVGGERHAERVQRLDVAGRPARPGRGRAGAAATRGTRWPRRTPARAPMSWSTNRHHTKPDWSATSAAAKASTAGSASPSFRPDSRFSEWRMMRGTRGLVTTAEESTGSVGESSAPSRNDSVHDNDGQRVRHQGDEDAGDRHREHELAQRQPPRALQHLALDLEPVAEQDHDQGDDREVGDERSARRRSGAPPAHRRRARSPRPRTAR